VSMFGGDVLVRVGADLTNFNRGFATAQARMNGFGGVAGKALLGVGVAAAIVGVKSLKAAGDYEAALNTFQAVSKSTGSQMKQVSTLAKQLGNDMSLPATSAKDAADAMTELAKGGLSVKDTMAAAKGVLQLSAAAQISNADAATITARALNSFKLSGDQAVHVADVLANAANKSSGEITDFGLALQQSSSVAHQTGLSIEDTTAALMSMAQAGIVGSDAGTSLKTMLMRFTPQSNQAAEAMKTLGVHTYDTSGQFVGIRNVISQYHDALVRLTPEQRQLALQTIFGQDAIRAANIVLGEGVGAFDRYRSAADQQGSAAELAAAKMKGFKGALEGFKSSLETLEITIGAGLLPVMTRLVQQASHGAQFVNDFATAVKGLGTDSNNARGGIVNAGNSAAHTGAQMTAGEKAAYQYADALAELKNDAHAIVSVFGSVVNALRSVGDANDWLGRKTMALNDTWSGWMHTAADAVTSFAKTVASKITGLASSVPGMAASIGAGISDGIISGIGGLGERLAGALTSKVGGAINSVKGVFGIHSPSEVTKQEIGAPLAEGVIVGWLTGAAELPSKMKDSVRAALEAAKRTVDAERGQLSDAMSRVSGDLLNAFDAINAAVKTKSEGLLDRLVSKHDAAEFKRNLADARAALTEAQGAVSSFAPAEGDTPEEVAAHRKELGAAVLSAQSAVDELLYQQQVAALEKKKAQEQIQLDARTALRRRHFEDALTSLSTALEKEGATAGEAHKSILKLLRSFGVNFKEVGQDQGRAYVEGLKEAIEAAASGAGKLSGTISNAADQIKVPHRAAGGPVSAGGLYMVGEKGPELFAPGTSGSIIPTGAGGAAGAVVVNVAYPLASKAELARLVLDALNEHSRGGGALFSRTAGVTV
jgi:TP901 family phage tail tape measure protein